MTVKEIFISKLKQAKYPLDANLKLEEDRDFSYLLGQLERDSQNVFRAMYGEKLIQNRGTRDTKEYLYRYMEAKKDVQDHMIPSTMHYLLTQIHIKSITL